MLHYLKAQKLRTLMARDFEAGFSACDFILMPSAPSAAFALGEKLDDPIAMYLSDVFTLPANLAGLPAASVPCAVADGMPLGNQIYAPFLGEPMLIRAAAALERAFPFKELRRSGVRRGLDGEAVS